MGKEQDADDPGVRALAWAQGRLLEALEGWWVDDGASSYEVHIDAEDGDTCSVRIWRRGGANFMRKAVIRMLTDKKGRPTGVTWNRSYSLDLDTAPIETVTWLSHKKAKPFVWRRWCDIMPDAPSQAVEEAAESAKASYRRTPAREEWAEKDWWNQTWWQDSSWDEEDEWGKQEGKKKKKEVNGTKTVWRERVKKEDDKGSFDVMALFEKAAAKSKASQKEAGSTQPSACSTSPNPGTANKPASELITELLQPTAAPAAAAPSAVAATVNSQQVAASAAAVATASPPTAAQQAQATQQAQQAAVAQQAYARHYAAAQQAAVAQQAAAAQHALAAQQAQQQVAAQHAAVAQAQQVQSPPCGVAAAAAANAVTAANAVASAHMLAQPAVQASGDYRQYYRCANPDCGFLVNPDPTFGGYCCLRCHYRHVTGSKTTKHHGSRCLQQVAHQSLPRAPFEEPVQRSALFEKPDGDLDGDEVEADPQAAGTNNSQYSAAAAAAAAAASMAPPGDWSAWNVAQQTVGRDAYGRPCMLPQYHHNMWSQAQYTHYQHAAAAAAFASALYSPPAAAPAVQRPAALPLSSPPELPEQDLLVDTAVPTSIGRAQPRRRGGGRKQKV